MSMSTLLRLLNEAKAIGHKEAAPLRPSTHHVSELSAQARWAQLMNDARSTQETVDA